MRAPVVAPAVTDFTTPHRYHNTTAHVADVAHDPRPLLPVDNEVHGMAKFVLLFFHYDFSRLLIVQSDFEVHREGAYAKGHTVPGAGVNKTAGTPAGTSTKPLATIDPIMYPFTV